MTLQHLGVGIGTLLASSALVYAQGVTDTPIPEPHGQWTLSGTTEAEVIGVGFPVSQVNKKNWSALLPAEKTDGRGRAQQSAELVAVSPKGWRLGWIYRNETWVNATSGAMELLALEDQRTDPVKPASYDIDAHWQSWAGHGILAQTPWMPFQENGVWQWRVGVQALQLSQLRSLDITGKASYQGNGQYHIDANYRRIGTNVVSPFMGPSGPKGWGGSLSLALDGRPLPEVRVALSVDDVVSRLEWSDLAMDEGMVNANNITKNPDGTLDYDARVKGKKSLGDVVQKIRPRTRLRLDWTPQGWFPLSLQVDSKAANVLYWVGTETGHWRVELEPRIGVLRLGYNRAGFNFSLGTDGRGAKSGYLAAKVAYAKQI